MEIHFGRQPKKTYRPGEWIEDKGDVFYPKKEPDLNEYMFNRYQHEYPSDGSPSMSAGYILSDGRFVEMGQAGSRGEDHRGMIPHASVMRQWKWPESVVRDFDEGSRYSALMELIKRSGAVRFHGSRNGTSIHHLTPLTHAQKRAILQFHEQYRPSSYLFETANGRSKDVDAYDLEDHLFGSQMSLVSTPISFARSTNDAWTGEKVRRIRKDDPVYTGDETPLTSSNLESVAYDAKPANNGKDLSNAGDMHIRFLQGTRYKYKRVPLEAYLSIRKAKSPGKTFWDKIRVRGSKVKHKYQYEQE